ncbi:TPM domain-containing protein|uniref:TPM domain-containing protein n=1 Tax=Dendrosporobacter quercicolus TaxID=146817 RepID=A0A1G9YX87_9FIRM|nr:TPM domain-containing protein [Dendrosporobacter quercicolus]NSL49271.1 TPM domain-containing protein [Dendrosporobacter quercicolus DSM 1736]SDN13789.1 uncharacterized protein SAMN04488502_112105 [Dendrosporobacter quercicolus]
MKKWLAWLVLIGCFVFGAAAGAEPSIPSAPTSSIYIQDYAGVVSADSKKRINELGSQLAAKTKAQIVVVTVKTLGETPLEDYALAILRQWGIGDKTLNNGVLLLVAVEDRKSRIEVGYGLEGALPDARTGQIQDEYMLSYFRQGNYDQGIMNGYLAVAGVVAKEYNLELRTAAQPAAKTQATAEQSWWDALPWWMQLAVGAGVLLLFVVDWLFFGGSITWLLLSLLRSRGGGGGGGRGGYGGGSGGGGGSSRGW